MTLLFLIVAVNYVAIAEALGVSPSVLAAGLAADNVICALYFTTLFALASKIPPEASVSTSGAYYFYIVIMCFVCSSSIDGCILFTSLTVT